MFTIYVFKYLIVLLFVQKSLLLIKVIISITYLLLLKRKISFKNKVALENFEYEQLLLLTNLYFQKDELAYSFYN